MEDFNINTTTKVTDEDINTAIRDNDGVLYSEDGKRLLKCDNADLSQYIIQDGTEVICDVAFSCCKNLITVSIPESVTEIGEMAFDRCWNLSEITIPYSVRRIGNEAFANCVGLVTAIISPGVSEIGDRAFFSCWNLLDITIPHTVHSIGDRVFSGCSQLETAHIYANITKIGIDMFYDCNSLVLIEIPDSVSIIGNGAFSYCRELTEITIPNKVTKIDCVTFFNCHKLEKIISPNPEPPLYLGYTPPTATCVLYVPKGAKDAYSNAYTWKNFKRIEEIPFIDETVLQKDYSTEATHEELINAIRDDYGVLYSKDGKRLLKCENTEMQGDYEVREGTEVICDRAFYGLKKLLSVSILDCVAKIGNEAFKDCEGMTELFIDSEKMIIGNGAFSGCKRLCEVRWNNSAVIKIGDEAFKGCDLHDITIPENATYIGNRAFRRCKKLHSITSRNPNPPICGHDAFEFKNRDRYILYIPVDAQEAYSTAPVWSNFFKAID